jgi:branched-chain amino acid transport system substrate-binding protein
MTMTDTSLIGRRSALGLAGAAAAAAVAPRRARAQAKQAKIAMLVPLSGPWARSGLLMQMGARMAVDEVNAAGGIKALGGAKLVMVEYDAGDSTEKAKDAAQRLVAQESDLSGGFGAWLSTFTLAITEVTERAQLPWLTLSYSDLITGRGFKYVFQASPTADSQAKGLVPVVLDLAEKASGKRPQKIGMVGDNSASSVSFYKAIHDVVVPQQKLNLVVDEVFTPPLSDATTLVQKVRSTRPDFCLLQSTNAGDDKLLVDKFNEMGLPARRMPLVGGGGHWCTPELTKLTTAENLEGVIVGLANWPGKAMQDVSKRFIERTKEPWFGHDSLFGYTHVMTLVAAMEFAKSADRQKIMEALHTMDLHDGPARFFPSGRLSFDEKGRLRDAQLCIVQWRAGAPVPVYPEAVATQQAVWPKTA